MSDSVFTKIIKREIPSKILHEDKECIAFYDVHPQAPTHFLVVPKKPIVRISESGEGDQLLLGHLLIAASKVAKTLGIEENGYRLVINNGRDGGESVPHLHLHVLAGRPLLWPPG